MTNYFLYHQLIDFYFYIIGFLNFRIPHLLRYFIYTDIPIHPDVDKVEVECKKWIYYGMDQDNLLTTSMDVSYYYKHRLTPNKHYCDVIITNTLFFIVQLGMLKGVVVSIYPVSTDVWSNVRLNCWWATL